ncbi:hypothetical protein OROGR_004940 [Orobanche gracilis]
MLCSIAAASATPIKFRVKPRNPFKSNHPANLILKKTFTPSNLTFTKTQNSNNSRSHFAVHSESPSVEFRQEEIWEDEDDGCPWEGAIMYKRNAAISHLEYCTTLERLGLAKISSQFSKSRASEMGLRVVRSVKDYPDGTPVLISVDVTRRREKLRLDGMIRTVIALNCNSCQAAGITSLIIPKLFPFSGLFSCFGRLKHKLQRCGEPAPQSVYSDFSLLLCEEPIEEPETIHMGVIFGQDRLKTLRMEADNEDALIELDDRLYFPSEEKVIDISKNIRDLIHVEITINAVCDPSCKGLCLRCCANLNIAQCTCSEQKVQEKGYGPLGDLRKQMQQT